MSTTKVQDDEGVDDIVPKDFSMLIERLRGKYVQEDEFQNLSSNEDRVEYCFKKEPILRSFERFIKNLKNSLQDYLKSNEKAKIFRLEGNKHFKQKKYLEALKCYSQALVSAPIPSTSNTKEEVNEYSNELPLAFANRSATLFHLNQFDDSLIDIENAINYGYPANQLHTLLIRRALCLKATGNTEEANKILEESLDSVERHEDEKIDDQDEEDSSKSEDSITRNKNELKKFMRATFESFNQKPKVRLVDIYKESIATPLKSSNPKIPYSSDLIKLNENEQKGRHFKAIKSINKDEVIISEKPYACILDEQHYDRFCHNCLIELYGRLYPCQNCSQVNYCSKKCSQESWENYHQYECGYLDILHQIGLLRLSLRMLVKGGISKSVAIYRETKSKNSKSYCGDYKSLLSLVDHSMRLSYIVSSRQTLAAAFILYIITNVAKMLDSNDKNAFTVGGLILKHIQQMALNSLMIFHQPILPGPMDVMGIDIKNTIIGSAVYPTVSLINHSCDANLELFYFGSHLSLKTNKPVSQGQEITISYGQIFKKMSRLERQTALENQFYFKCECECCLIPQTKQTDDSSWPPYLLADAVYCSKCRGPVVLNIDKFGYCLACNYVQEDLTNLLEKMDMAKKQENLGKALIQFGRAAEGEKLLQKALSHLNNICFPHNRLIIMLYNDLVYCNTMLENYDMARKFCETGSKMKKVIHGENSLEYISGLLHLLNIKWVQQNKLESNNQGSLRTTSMNKKLIHKLIKETDTIIDKTKALINDHKTGDGLLVLEPNLMSCLKDLIELEKYRKIRL